MPACALGCLGPWLQRSRMPVPQTCCAMLSWCVRRGGVALGISELAPRRRRQESVAPARERGHQVSCVCVGEFIAQQSRYSKFLGYSQVRARLNATRPCSVSNAKEKGEFKVEEERGVFCAEPSSFGPVWGVGREIPGWGGHLRESRKDSARIRMPVQV